MWIQISGPLLSGYIGHHIVTSQQQQKNAHHLLALSGVCCLEHLNISQSLAKVFHGSATTRANGKVSKKYIVATVQWIIAGQSTKKSDCKVLAKYAPATRL